MFPVILAILAPAETPVPVLVKLTIALIAILYVFTPLYALIFQKQRARMTATAMPSFDVMRQMDADSTDMLQGMANQMAGLGFAVGQPLRIPTSDTGVGYAVLGEAPNGDVAESYVLTRPNKDGIARHDWTNFHSHTRNVARTVTSNTTLSSGIAPRAGHNSFSARGVKDLGRLYGLHEVRVRDSGGRRRQSPPLGDHATFVESEAAAGTDNMVARGYSRRSGPSGETLRLTPKGAFLIAWRQLPPWTNVAAAKAERTIAELEARVPRTAPLARSA